MKSIQIKDSYNVWSRNYMTCLIMQETATKYHSPFSNEVLNRSWRGMYTEWYLHNIGYWLTLPFIKNEYFNELNTRFKHLDLEEHI